MREENIPCAEGVEGDSPNKNGCCTTHAATWKNKTQCPHLKPGYIKTHNLVVAIFKPPLLCLQQTSLQLNVTGQEVYSELKS